MTKLLRMFVLPAFVLFLGEAPALAADCPAAVPVKAAAASFTNAAKSRSPAAFSSALSRHSNVSSLAMFALGPYRKQLPKARQGEYVNAAHAFMGRFLADNAGRISAKGLKIRGCNGGIVESEAGGRAITWRVAGGSIQDVRIGGVWLAAQLRSKFTRMIKTRNGDVEAFIDALNASQFASR